MFFRFLLLTTIHQTILLSILSFEFLLYFNQQVYLQAKAVPLAIKTNKMRYATSETTPISALSTEQQVLMQPEYAASNIDYSSSIEPYKLVSLSSYHNQNKKNERVPIYDSFHKGKLLDEEDKSLLEKFYKETKESDPFNSVWLDGYDDIKSNNNYYLNDLIDDHNKELFNLSKDLKNIDLISSKEVKNVEHDIEEHNGWTIDPSYNYKTSNYDNTNYFDDYDHQNQDLHSAKYSPTLRLLTSYNPIKEANKNLIDEGDNKIVGITLFGNDENSAPNISSKSANDAIRLHDSLLRDPPRDGNVRVRMYYHRAIHDEAKLYGNGPWKYWGHGWGLEFGFDPRRMEKDNFYQKGYTIERAFGRDFCRDKLNCRQSDPKFFDDPLNVGKYSSDNFNLAKQQPIDGLTKK